MPSVTNLGLQSISILFNAAALAEGLIHPPRKVQIGTELDVILVDATLNETHSAPSEVTQHPVEVGADVTDHIRPKPAELRIDGIVTNTPTDPSLLDLLKASPVGLGIVAADTIVKAALGTADLAARAFDQLREIRDQGKVITIVTPLRTYEQMAMTELQVVRDPQVGDALHFQAAFIEIRTVESATTSIQLPPAAQDSLNMGTQSTEKPSGGLLKLNGDPLEKWLGPLVDKWLPQKPGAK